jgi:hypothetical protein
MKHIPFEYYRVLSVPSTPVLAVHARTGTQLIGLLARGLQQVQEVPDLMCDVLSSLEVVDIL